MTQELIQIIAETCGFIAGSIGVVQGLPQIMRIRRLGHADGLELGTWLLMCVQFSAWAGYGVLVHSPSIWVTNTLTLVTTAMVVFGIRGRNLKSLAMVCGLAAAGFAFVLFAPTWLSSIALAAFTASRLPQLIRTFINRNRTTATAVSISSLALTTASCLLWMAYSVLYVNVLTIITTSVALFVILATATLEIRIARRATV